MIRKRRHSIVLIDKHPIVLQGVRTLLSCEDDLNVLISSTALNDIFKLPENQTVDLVIIDLPQFKPDVVAFIERLEAGYPDIKMLVYTMLEDERLCECLKDIGAAGCLPKTSPSAKLLEAVRCVLDGETYYPPALLRRRRQRKDAVRHAVSAVGNLSRREMEVFMLMGKALDSAAISSRLKISRNTVDTHRINIKKKLGVSSSKELYRLSYCFCEQNRLGNMGSAIFPV